MSEPKCTLAHAIERAQSYPDGHWCRVLLAELQRLQAAERKRGNPTACIRPMDTPSDITRKAHVAHAEAIRDLKASTFSRGKCPPLHRPKGWIYPQDRAPWYRRLWAWFRAELRRPQAFPLNDPRAHP